MGDSILDRTTCHCFILVHSLLFQIQAQVCSDFIVVFQTVFLSLSDFIGEGPLCRQQDKICDDSDVDKIEKSGGCGLEYTEMGWET
jgi:hypothetical protein